MTDLRTPPVNDGDLFSERARQYALEKPLQRIHILEAGCGWGTGLDLGGRDRVVTGVDLESPELRAHACERPDLDEWHLGDLRTVPMPPRAYDIVHATYLVERVPHAELVLDRFVAALKPGGLLLVHLRDRNTAFGFLDRHLPRWMHASGRRRRARRARPVRAPRGAHARVPAPSDGAAGGPAKTAGPPAEPERAVLARDAQAERPEERTAPAAPPATPAAPEPRAGRARPPQPPPAIYDRVASRQGMQWYCVMRGLMVSEEYTSRQAIDALGAGTGLTDLLCRLVAAASRGRLTADHSDVTLVIRKPENRFARVI
ncbi:class I SAM-dependent methyltransferase [Actinomadura opuntiae]|uniref:class I SAM-dependent methyltransferase n=1 Tax=Actinomadura sp. OS1-43 TaxID=604315 RepID=UPI00255AF292|nr:class I SAM-dependent methyltransferase [Actinomadura sp. OS1-43]MDL4815695.1 class I SAM-dependent methyltransferase [Actinomadura sp. OS1-43]